MLVSISDGLRERRSVQSIQLANLQLCGSLSTINVTVESSQGRHRRGRKRKPCREDKTPQNASSRRSFHSAPNLPPPRLSAARPVVRGERGKNDQVFLSFPPSSRLSSQAPMRCGRPGKFMMNLQVSDYRSAKFRGLKRETRLMLHSRKQKKTQNEFQ